LRASILALEAVRAPSSVQARDRALCPRKVVGGRQARRRLLIAVRLAGADPGSNHIPCGYLAPNIDNGSRAVGLTTCCSGNDAERRRTACRAGTLRANGPRSSFSAGPPCTHRRLQVPFEIRPR